MLREIASEVVVKYCSDVKDNSVGTCGCVLFVATKISHKFHGLPVIQKIAEDALNTYEEFSGARSDTYGFIHISRDEWSNLTVQEKTRYREDILYYFWMANQEM